MAVKYWVGVKSFVYNIKLKKFLLIQRALDDSAGGCWENPGGKKEIGEDITDTLKRELKEETGITIDSYKLLYATAINENKNPFMIIGFLSTTKDIDVKLSFEHIAYKWCDAKELLSIVDKGIQKDFKDAKIEELVKEFDKLEPHTR